MLSEFVGFVNFMYLFVDLLYFDLFCMIFVFSLFVMVSGFVVLLLFVVCVDCVICGVCVYCMLLIWLYVVVLMIVVVLWVFLFNLSIGLIMYVFVKGGIVWNYVLNGG